MNSIFERSSIRKYLDKPVEEEKIDLLLKAGMSSPTAGNQREYEFIVVTDKEVLQKLSEMSPYAGPAGRAPLVIALCADPSGCRFVDYWQQDLGACAENIWLEATELGLGAVWMGIAPLKDRMDKMSEILEIPEGVLPFGIISIGYPAEEKKAKDRFESAKVHYNRY